MKNSSTISVLFYGCYPMSLSAYSALAKAPEIDIIGLVTRKNGPLSADADLISPKHPVFELNSLKRKDLPPQLVNLEANLLVCCAYPLKIPELLRSKAQLAAINIHPSLLPRLRGADPLRRAILEGHQETGISVINLTDNYDEGDVWWQKSAPIYPEDNLLSLHGRLSQEISNNITSVISNIAQNKLAPVSQNEEKVTYASSITEQERVVTFSRTTQELDRIVRANHGWRPAHTIINDRKANLFHISYQANTQSQTARVKVRDSEIDYIDQYGWLRLGYSYCTE